MARIVVIGGSGHVGSYLIPVLIGLGHEVINVSRGGRKPYCKHSSWSSVQTVLLDRSKEEEKGLFGEKIAELEADIVIDMICFNLASTKQIVEALRGKVEHYLFCSSIWVYGKLVSVPASENAPTNPIDDYGRGKAESEAWLLRESRRTGFPATCFRPGHIVGEGWVPTNPLGNSNPETFSLIASGKELVLPNLGSETLHHVHAEDVAQWIICAIENRALAVGEVFNTVSEQAITMRGYAEITYGWFGKSPKISFKPFEQWLIELDDLFAENSYGHVVRSSSHSIEKSRIRLGYRPKYTSLQAIEESVNWLIKNGVIKVPNDDVTAN